MVYAVLLHSEIPHGYVTRVLKEEAMSVEGVVGIFDCFDPQGHGYNRYKSNFDQDTLQPQEHIFNRYVRFIGDRIGAVVATTRAAAERAAGLVRVEYERLPHSIGFDDTLSGQAEPDGGDPVRDSFSFEAGTAPDLNGLVRVETDMEIPRLHHAAMEPHACLADYDPVSGELRVTSPNQAVHGIRTVLSEIFDMPQSMITVVKAPMGGSFGAKQEWFTEPAAALLAIRLCRPVQLVFTREEAMLSAYVRGAMRTKCIAYYTPEGRIRSLDVDLVMDAGAYLSSSSDYIRAYSGKIFRCYNMEHVRFRARLISSNTPVAGAFRGWSSPEEAIMMEHAMDAAAARLGIDRVRIRLINAECPGGRDVRNGVPLEDFRIREALETGRDRFGWEEKKADDRRFNASQTRYRRGVGVGCGGHGSTYYPRFNDYGEGRLQMNADGTVQAFFTLHDHGCGTVTVIRLILAEVLSLPEDRIRVTEATTAYTPVDFGCFASRTTYVLGAVAEKAARALLRELVGEASEISGLDAGELYPENGAIRDAGGTVSYPYGTLARHVMKHKRKNISVQVQEQVGSNPGVAGAHFAHVEVDTLTGFTRVLDYLAVQDIGQPINAGMCVAQVQGAVQMGCSVALREKLIPDAGGRFGGSLSRYHLFLAPDLPDIQVHLLTGGKSEHGPFGAKSIGEVCFVPATPAVCSAVNDALGCRIDRLPYDPDCLLNLLRKEREAQ